MEGSTSARFGAPYGHDRILAYVGFQLGFLPRRGNFLLVWEQVGTKCCGTFWATPQT